MNFNKTLVSNFFKKVRIKLTPFKNGSSNSDSSEINRQFDLNIVFDKTLDNLDWLMFEYDGKVTDKSPKRLYLLESRRLLNLAWQDSKVGYFDLKIQNSLEETEAYLIEEFGALAFLKRDRLLLLEETRKVIELYKKVSPNFTYELTTLYTLFKKLAAAFFLLRESEEEWQLLSSQQKQNLSDRLNLLQDEINNYLLREDGEHQLTYDNIAELYRIFTIEINIREEIRPILDEVYLELDTYWLTHNML